MREVRLRSIVKAALPMVPCREPPGPGRGKVIVLLSVPMANDSGSPKSAIVGLLAVLASIGGLALLVWFMVVLLDLKHLNTSGFTLP